MNKKEAIEILKTFNTWRRDNSLPPKVYMPDPKDIGKALDFIVEFFDKERNVLDQVLNFYEGREFLKADGLDDAILGVEEESERLIYSVSKSLDILQKDGDMSYAEALEFFTFNISGSYMGDKTPIWCWDNFE